MDFFIYMIFRLFMMVVCMIPTSTGAALGRIIGRIFYYVDRHHQRIITANISLVYGKALSDSEIQTLGRESCEYLAMNIIDLLKLNKIVTAENYRKFLDIRGLDHLMQAIKRGKGTIAVMGHFGNFPLIRYACYLNLPPKAVIIRKLDNPYLENFVKSILKTHDVTIIRPRGALNKIRELLLKNFVTLTLADQKAGGPKQHRYGVSVDLFGIPSQTHITAPLLQRRTGAAVLPAFVIRKGPLSYRIEIHEPPRFTHTKDEALDLNKNTRMLNTIFESYIEKYPQEWFWLHRRWKNVTGLENLYKTNNPLKLVEDFRKKIKTSQV
jgi:Kdo2-lipid IVA lauroyltransferase/acyltransferase